MTIPRVAFFADSFHEVNGVATTSRQFANYARERDYPFFSVHAGPRALHTAEDSFETFEIPTSRAAIRLQADLSFDLLFARHLSPLSAALSRFKPDLIHITGPSHCGCLGLLLAYKLGVPLVASWHTNLHEYAAQRLKKVVRGLPAPFEKRLLRVAEALSLSLMINFYRFPRLLFAPNPELVDLLATHTGRPTHPMQRGIDTHLFSPSRRERSDSTFIIGYVGRLSSEKNVRLLAQLERALIEKGISDYRFVIIGGGSESSWLREHMRSRELPGVLLGRELATSYAGMDAFVFPSTTDTYGNVILESLASGVPPIVSAGGGPKYLVNPGVTGFVAKDVAEYAHYVMLLRENQDLRQRMSQNARNAASAFSWSAVFERVYQTYGEAIESGLIAAPSRRRAEIANVPQPRAARQTSTPTLASTRSRPLD